MEGPFSLELSRGRTDPHEHGTSHQPTLPPPLLCHLSPVWPISTLVTHVAFVIANKHLIASLAVSSEQAQ